MLAVWLLLWCAALWGIWHAPFEDGLRALATLFAAVFLVLLAAEDEARH